jgi:hypothetical protein
VIAIVLFKNPPPADRGNIERLQSVYFINAAAQLGFEDSQEIPAEWKRVGEVALNVKARDGLGPASTQPNSDKRDYKAGALVLAESVAPDQPRMIDATFKLARPTDAIIPEVFIAEGPLDSSKANRELVWMLAKGGTPQIVLADGSVPTLADRPDARKPQTLNVKVRFNKDTVIVEMGDKRLYDGPHKLSESTPRYLGVRFRRKVDDKTDGVYLQSIKVLKP